jgi:hypothetical protein
MTVFFVSVHHSATILTWLITTLCINALISIVGKRQDRQAANSVSLLVRPSQINP